MNSPQPPKHQDRATHPAKLARPVPKSRAWPRIALGVLLMLALLWVGLVLYWSRQPEVGDVERIVQERIAGADHQKVNGQTANGQPAPGTAFVATTIFVADTLLHKPGGFTHNDRLPPSGFMNNMPSWECGMVMALRDALQALRNDFTRSRSQSREELNIKRAEQQFAIDPKSWMMPAAEDEYRKGVAALELYLDDLDSQTASAAERFFPRSDNLAAYLGLVEKRLGNFGVRLSGSVANAERPAMAGGGVGDARAKRAPQADNTPSIQHVFYCARGYSWALLHLMRAIQIDFAQVLENKNAEAAVERIVRDLEGAVKRMRSPMVLNGHGYGLMANHSLVIASYISRVNAAIIDLKLLLLQG